MRIGDKLRQIATNGKMTKIRNYHINNDMNDSEECTAELFSAEELCECESIPAEVRKKIKSDEEAGKYTAQTIKKRKPQIYSAITAMLGGGLPFTYISNMLGVHYCTVEAVAQCESDYINKCKERLAKMGFSISQRVLEKISDGIDTLKLNKTDDFYKATLISNKLAETANLLSGGVTERVVVETEKNYNSAEEYEKDMWSEGAIDV